MPDRSNIHETLARFTPHGVTLNRDELFFAAGRASAPSRRWWIALVGVLVVSQTALLLAWSLSSPPSPIVPTPTIPTPTVAPVLPADIEPREQSPYSLLQARRNIEQEGDWLRPTTHDNLRPDLAPLHVRSRGLGD